MLVGRNICCRMVLSVCRGRHVGVRERVRGVVLGAGFAVGGGAGRLLYLRVPATVLPDGGGRQTSSRWRRGWTRIGAGHRLHAAAPPAAAHGGDPARRGHQRRRHGC